MATWPTSLPAPQLPGYALETQDATRRTDMEGGPARTRRVSTSVPDKVTLRFLFDAAQMATFRSFWELDWDNGANWIAMQLKDGRTEGAALRECRPVPAVFKSAPVSATHWHVEMAVEIRPAAFAYPPPVDLGDLTSTVPNLDLGELL